MHITPAITLFNNYETIKVFLLSIAIILFVSCERTIDLKVKNQPPKLVVDASIENNGTPLVVLSNFT